MEDSDDFKPYIKASHYYYIVIQTYFYFVWLFKQNFHKFFIKLGCLVFLKVQIFPSIN